MSMFQVTNKSTGHKLADKVKIARSFFQRTKGLLCLLKLEKGEGLYITKCGSIHTFFMLFSIDVLFLDKKNRITKVVYDLTPFKVAFGPRGTSSVLELPAHTLKQNICSIGDEISLGIYNK